MPYKDKIKALEWGRNRYQLRKTTILIQHKKYAQSEKGKIANKKKSKKYYDQNKDKIFKVSSIRHSERKKIDPIFKLKCRLRVRLWESFKKKGWNKGRSEELLGCGYEFLKSFIENQFQKGMTLENHGKWHIDHKMALSKAKNEKELIQLFHYTNLQPLWAEDNLKKREYENEW